MARKNLILFVALIVLLISMEINFAHGEGGGNGKGNDNGKGNEGGNGGGNDNGSGKDKGKGDGNDKGNNGGNGNQGNDKGNGKGKGDGDNNGNKGGNGKDNGKGNGERAETDYVMLSPVDKTGQERAVCQAEGRCYQKNLTCPAECSERKPMKAKKSKACFIDCNKCETTCKKRKPNCEGYGSICYDPRFVGGDGVMFYFHGAKGGDFALVSDDRLQINAHFIGSRPTGRTRDYTWVQALSVMFDSHSLVIAAQRVTKWDDNVDALILRWDGDSITNYTEGDAEWRVMSEANGGGREVVVERTEETNSVKVTIAGLVSMDVKVTPIGERENKIHNYQLPEEDAFAHLETQFRFTNLSDMVEGVLGKTYRPGYVSPVKVGVPMPMMGGEDRYRTPSLLSPLCRDCRFQQPLPATNSSGVLEMAQY